MQRLPLYVFVGAAMLAGLATHPAAAATLTTGPGQQYTTIAAAVAASRDGDIVNVLAGTYVNDFAEIRTKISLLAVGGQVRMQAQGNIPNGKAILITDTDITITGFMFTGAKVSDTNGGNGAGIRYQGGKLVLDNCYFLTNQNGLLGGAVPGGTITVSNSEFAHNGVASGPSSGFTHNIYVGAIATFDAENSYFHDANVGHEIKSRARVTIVNNSRVVDGPTGTASYSIDLPNGGKATITNNQIEQGPKSQNPVIISFGEEGGVYAGSALTVQNNLIENDLQSGSARGVQNAATITAQVTGSRLYGLPAAQLVAGKATVSGTTILTTKPVIATTHPWAK
jgi:hypothetical protein